MGCIKLLDVSTVIVTIFDIYACCYSFNLFRQVQDYIVFIILSNHQEFYAFAKHNIWLDSDIQGEGNLKMLIKALWHVHKSGIFVGVLNSGGREITRSMQDIILSIFNPN